VPIKVVAGFGLLRGFKLADTFRLTKSEAIDAGTLIALLPFGSLSNGPKIDHLNHSVHLDGKPVRFNSALNCW
jgi:hypothetical protein